MDMSFNFMEQEEKWKKTARQMAINTNRGKQDRSFLTNHFGASGVFRSREPESFLEQSRGGNRYAVVFDGELTNREALRAELKGRGYAFRSQTDIETVLITYMQFGEGSAQKLEGVYAFAVWDDARQRCFLCRDRMGGRQLYYTLSGGTLAFASVPAGLFAFPGVRPEVGREGWCALLAAAPLFPPEKSLYQGISALPPGFAMVWEAGERRLFPYFRLEYEAHSDDYDKTVRIARDLLFDAVAARLEEPERLGAWLDRRADAGLVAAVAAGNLTQRLNTYALEPPEEPSMESGMPWPELVSGVLHANHHTLLWENSQVADALYGVVKTGLFPGAWADFSAVFFQVCRQVGERRPVLLAGVCGTPLFGQCSWMAQGRSFQSFFEQTWKERRCCFQKEWAESLQPDEYIRYLWENALIQAPGCYGENTGETLEWQGEYLSGSWSIRAALELADHLGNSGGLTVRLPMADARLVQYLFRVPKEFKRHGGRNGALMRDVLRGLLPDSLFPREKPALLIPAQGYGVLVRSRLAAILADASQPLRQVADLEGIRNLTSGPISPVLLRTASYLLQLNEWMREFHISA